VLNTDSRKTNDMNQNHEPYDSVLEGVRGGEDLRKGNKRI